jgi:hypothetical protein
VTAPWASEQKSLAEASELSPATGIDLTRKKLGKSRE